MEIGPPDSPRSNAKLVALAKPDDMLLELSFPSEKAKFLDQVEAAQREIECIVRWHLKLRDTETPRAASRDLWLLGNFNVNIPVYIDNWSRAPRQRVLVRIPLPYKLGEARCHGNVDEKLRCEVATFVWLLDRHPTVPVPFLWGFGFRKGSCFSAVNKADDVHVARNQSQGRDTHFTPYQPASYYRHDHEFNLSTGYLIMDFIEEADGKLLSRCWSSDKGKKELRLTFLADLANIMLTLSSVKFDGIGSIRFSDDGFLSLSNRPLHFRLQQLENKGVPLDIPRSRVYKDTAPYFSDLLACHAQRIRHQRNAITDRADAQRQFAVQCAMQALMPIFSRRDSSKGPFYFRLTDVHPNNVLVDDSGHIKCVIDLEWAVVHPLEFVHPPVWLTGRKVNELVGTDLEQYTLRLHEFLNVFNDTERALDSSWDTESLFTTALRRNWESKAFFYFQGLENPNTCGTLFFQHILPHLKMDVHGERLLSFLEAWASLWGHDREAVIQDRLQDRESYLDQLRGRVHQN